MLAYNEVILKNLIVHFVGNKNNDETLSLSDEAAENFGEGFVAHLLDTCFAVFKNTHDIYSFNESNTNQIVQQCCTHMLNKKAFVNNSKQIATHLYDTALHTNIKKGELIIMQLEQVWFENIPYKAIGIFKSETKKTFLHIENYGTTYALNIKDGIIKENIDKACLILEGTHETPMKVLSFDKNGKQEDARFWHDYFLNIIPATNNYSQTKLFMNMAKEYASSAYTEDFDIVKADQIDLLNKSLHYFKNNESFNQETYTNEVLYHPEVKESFAKFTDQYKNTNHIEFEDEFDINTQAVNNAGRGYNRVIKLDKNFHVYVHGNRHLIERGYDDVKGKYFYKIFFDEEA
jgi:hypothetical protein